MDNAEGPPVSQTEQTGSAPDKPLSVDKPKPELVKESTSQAAEVVQAKEAGELAKIRATISEQAETKKPKEGNEQVTITETVNSSATSRPARKTSIVGDDPYPNIPVVRGEGVDSAPMVAEQDFQPEDFNLQDYFHGIGMGSNYGKVVGGGYRAYDNDRFWSPVVKAVQRHLPANAARVLEVGCAEGYLVKRLQQAGLKEAIGIDISPTVLAEAKKNVPGARFEEVNLNRDTFNPELNGTFDAITAMDVLEHTAHREGPNGEDISGVAHVVPKLVALLKKDGVFMMSAPVVDKNIVSRIFNFFDSDKSHVSKLPSEEYLKILEQNGLVVMEKRYLFLVPWVRIPFLHTALEVVAKKK